MKKSLLILVVSMLTFLIQGMNYHGVDERVVITYSLTEGMNYHGLEGRDPIQF
ncbi:hypothetical protein [Chengkuizengella marina]|uniref:hypothetical protein n=1 Tax=Chengkuizengella marina TaxID=2507566 RepID=UPI001370EED5|nr:hypothetical protein [Chengkuizengella marina]